MGDLWWRPNTSSHLAFAAGVEEVLDKVGVTLLLVDGNNDDAQQLGGGCDGVVDVGNHMKHLTRGCRWRWGDVRAGALGGAVTYRREGKTLGVDLFAGEATTERDVQKSNAGGRVDLFFSHDAPGETSITANLCKGPDAENRRLVGRAVAEASPRIAFHGHYQKPYQQTLQNGVEVMGLGRDAGESADVCVVSLVDCTVVFRDRV